MTDLLDVNIHPEATEINFAYTVYFFPITIEHEVVQ